MINAFTASRAFPPQAAMASSAAASSRSASKETAVKMRIGDAETLLIRNELLDEGPDQPLLSRQLLEINSQTPWLATQC
jgi:hypothetical protein